MTARDYEIFELGDVALQSGLTLRNAQLAYKTFGRLNQSRSNVIVYPTSYGAQHTDIEWLIRPGRALDPDRYFIIIPNMFGNGLSSSPSNVGPPHDRGRFPGVTAARDRASTRSLCMLDTGGQAAVTVNFKPSARTTFSTVANSGRPSGDRALYRLCRPNPVPRAISVMPLERATAPRA